MAIATTNPATGETVREFDSLTQQELEEKIQRSWDTFQTYRDTTFTELDVDGSARTTVISASVIPLPRSETSCHVGMP